MSNLDYDKHPIYEPEKWNKNIYIKKSHNCYSYALNLIDKKHAKSCEKYMKKTKKTNCSRFKPQPGAHAGDYDKRDNYKYYCPKLTRRIIEDNPDIKKLRKNQKCPNGYYMIALACSDNRKDYHFYRQDKNGTWSHKHGGNIAKNIDESGKIIKNPEKADRGRYKIFCGYFIVPNDNKNRRMGDKIKFYRERKKQKQLRKQTHKSKK